MSYVLKEQKLLAANQILLGKIQNHLNINDSQLTEKQLLNEFCLCFFSIKFNNLFFINQSHETWKKSIKYYENELKNIKNSHHIPEKKEQRLKSWTRFLNGAKESFNNSNAMVSILTTKIIQNGNKKLLKRIHLLLDIDKKSLSLNQLLQYISQSFFSKPFEEAKNTIFVNENSYKTIKSSSLYSENCNDSIRFLFEGGILHIVKGGKNTYDIFNIVNVKNVNINNVVHTVLTSNKNDTFYIVDNKFHREDNEPAIFMQDCKIWMKNGLYHRENDKPAIDSDGLFVWVKNGMKYTPSFLSKEYYSLNSSDNTVLNKDKLQEALK